MYASMQLRPLHMRTGQADQGQVSILAMGTFTLYTLALLVIQQWNGGGGKSSWGITSEKLNGSD